MFKKISLQKNEGMGFGLFEVWSHIKQYIVPLHILKQGPYFFKSVPILVSNSIFLIPGVKSYPNFFLGKTIF